MKISITRIMAALLLGAGLYGVVASAIFAKKHVFSYSQTDTEAKQYYTRWVQPGIEERMARLDLSAATAADKTNLQAIVKWIAIDHDSARNMAMRGHVALFSLSVSLFAIVLGVLLLLWARQTDLRKQLETQTQQATPPYSEPATRSPQR
jgi:hypothetical protein